jgi:hypothetical protein
MTTGRYLLGSWRKLQWEKSIDWFPEFEKYSSGFELVGFAYLSYWCYLATLFHVIVIYLLGFPDFKNQLFGWKEEWHYPGLFSIKMCSLSVILHLLTEHLFQSVYLMDKQLEGSRFGSLGTLYFAGQNLNDSHKKSFSLQYSKFFLTRIPQLFKTLLSLTF